VNCDAALAALEARFAGDAAESDDALAAHLAGCPSCRAVAERLDRVDAALEHGALAPHRADALEARVLARVAGPAPQPVPLPPRRRAFLVAGLAMAAALAIAVVGVVRWRATDDFSPRGGPAGSTYGVRAFCVDAAGAVSGSALPGGALRCAPGSVVQLTYTAPSPAFLSVEVDGTSDRLFPAGGERAKVAAGVDVALPHSTPVGAWLDSPRVVTARFTDEGGAVLAESRVTISP